MNKNFTLSIVATLALGFAATACGGSDTSSGTSDSASGPSTVDAETSTGTNTPGDADTGPSAESADGGEFGGPGRWSAKQLCSLSTPEAVSLQFDDFESVEMETVDDLVWTSCSWADAESPIVNPQIMRIAQYGGYETGRMSWDVDLDIGGADMAGYSDNNSGSAVVDAVVGDQWLQVSFPVGTEGAQEFGAVIASNWVAAQQG